jgi:hypothetical protein
LRVKSGSIDGHTDIANLDRDAGEDVGEWLRARAVDLSPSRFRVKRESLAHDHGAEVKGACNSRDDRDSAEGITLVRAAKIYPAGYVGEVRANSRPRQHVPDL